MDIHYTYKIIMFLPENNFMFLQESDFIHVKIYININIHT